jgi:hypothetical protein
MGRAPRELNDYEAFQRRAYNAAPSRVGPGDSPEGSSGRLVTLTEELAEHSVKPRGLRRRARSWPVPVRVRCLR